MFYGLAVNRLHLFSSDYQHMEPPSCGKKKAGIMLNLSQVAARKNAGYAGVLSVLH